MIAYDNSTANRTSGTSISYSYTATGANLLMIVGMWVGTAQTPTVTYNSVPLTVYAGSPYTGEGAGNVYLCYLIGPATGAHTLAISIGGGAQNIDSAVATYSGVKQSGFADASSEIHLTNQGNFSKALTTVADNCWLAAVTAQSVNVPTAGANTTLRADGSTENIIFADSNAAKTPAGSYSLAWTNAGSLNGVSGIIVSFEPFIATSGGMMNFFIQ